MNIKRTTLCLTAAAALFSTACERHTAAELEGGHGSPHTDATQHAHSAPAQPNPSTPMAPTTIGTNPAGSGPVKVQAAREGTGQPHPDTAPHARPVSQ